MDITLDASKISIELAERIVANLAKFVFDNPQDWQLPFVLARKLKGLSPTGQPEDFRMAVQTFCEKTDSSFDDFFVEFHHVWDRVRHPETGDDTLAWAHTTALDEPIALPETIPRPPIAAVSVVYSMAWHLACRSAPDPFFLPRKRLAELLGLREPKSVTRIVQWLEKHGLVTCVDQTFQFGSGRSKCKLYSLSTMPNKRS